MVDIDEVDGGEVSELSSLTVFVKENQIPIALGGEVIGIEDFNLVIDRFVFFCSFVGLFIC